MSLPLRILYLTTGLLSLCALARALTDGTAPWGWLAAAALAAIAYFSERQLRAQRAAVDAKGAAIEACVDAVDSLADELIGVTEIVARASARARDLSQAMS